MNCRVICIFIAFNLVFLSASAQKILKFTQRTDKFVFELGEFFKDVDSRELKKAGEMLVARFDITYNSGFFDEEHKMLMINTCNQMLVRKMKTHPHFANYLEATIAFTTTSMSTTSFVNWHKSFERLIVGRTAVAKFNEYMEDCISLFTAAVLFESNSVQWVASSGQFRFDYDNQPMIVFDKTDLICRSKNDSSIIAGTVGTYYPLDKRWRGKGGKVDFRRADVDTNTVFALLNNYEVNVKFPKYTADTVNFYNRQYFKEPLLGRLDEKVFTFTTAEKANFPQFDSYEVQLSIRNIYDNVDYRGGFSQRGSRILGTGNETENAQLIFKMGNKPFIICNSKAYLLLPDRVTAQRSGVSIFWETDSIFHPALQMDYNATQRKLTLFRDLEGLSRSPFYSSFHKLDIYVESITWNMDLPKLDLKSDQILSGVSEAYFMSSNYFRRQEYERLKGIDRENPLMPIKRFCEAYNTRMIFLNEYAQYIKINPDNVKAQLLHLSNLGFIMYDLDNDVFYAKDRLFNNINCFLGKSDYDVIDFSSVTNRINNATISLLNFDLRIEGVNQIILSDSQNVVIYPFQNQITVKKNRDFTFDGKVNAGYFTLHGKECYFDYEKFKLELPIIDSLSFKVQSFTEKTNEGTAILVNIKSVLEDLGGNILLDHPNNKSGLKPFHEYPILNSIKSSYVYYDRKDIQGGVYRRDRFYYRVEPFTIDSLDNFKTEGLAFKGYLASAGVFPDINEELRVMPDYSLGFVNMTPASGYPAYGGKGTFFNEVGLSNKGLRGNGSLDFLTSTTFSEDFVFFPDSMNTDAQRYVLREVKKGTEFPEVAAEDVKVRWYPYHETMTVAKKQKAIQMYNNQCLMNGTLTLNPNQLTGIGMTQIGDAEMDAYHFRFKNTVYDADTSNFRLKMRAEEMLPGTTSLTAQWAYQTQNFKGHIDFTKRLGEFQANAGDSMVTFPSNMYICYMDKFVWYMDKDETEFSSTKDLNYAETSKLSMKELVDLDFEGSEFVSIHPDQDSLRFKAQKATYKRLASTISAEDVLFIRVADAMVVPGDGKVTILRKAEMQPLSMAKILANTTTRYHEITSANVNIFGRKRYDGKGVYDFKDETGNIQNIYFSIINVDTTFQTRASGEVHTSAGFTLSPMFGFAGRVELAAAEEFLTFDGATKISHKCDTIARSWMQFRSQINPIDIQIPVAEELKDIDGLDMYAGILLSDDTIGVYASFLSRAGRRSDSQIIGGTGVLVYDKATDEYRIAHPEKLRQLSRPGNYLSLNRKKCITYGEGRIDMGRDFGRAELNSFGEIEYYSDIDSTEARLFVQLNFHFNENALKMLNEALAKYQHLDGLNLNSEVFQKGIGEVLGDEPAQKLISELTLNSSIRRFPDPLRKTFTLSDVTMRWNPKTKAFVSTGKIGIAFIDRNQVYKYADGVLEINRTRSGDDFTLYLEFAENDWYLFEYQRAGRMLVISSNEEFNTIIRETKQDDRRLKQESGQKPYEYRLSTPVNRRNFLRKYPMK